MKFNVQQLAISAALTMGVAYLVCALVVGLWPDVVLKLMQSLFHLVNLQTVFGTMNITFTGFFSGLVQAMLYPYLAILGFGWFYNFLAGHRLDTPTQ